MIVVTKAHVEKAIRYLENGRSGFCCNALGIALRDDGNDIDSTWEAVADFLHPLLKRDHIAVNGTWRNTASDGYHQFSRVDWMRKIAKEMPDVTT